MTAASAEDSTAAATPQPRSAQARVRPSLIVSPRFMPAHVGFGGYCSVERIYGIHERSGGLRRSHEFSLSSIRAKACRGCCRPLPRCMLGRPSHNAKVNATFVMLSKWQMTPGIFWETGINSMLCPKTTQKQTGR